MRLTPEILERYYQGTCSAEEKAAVEQWLNLPEKAKETQPGFPQETLWQQIKASANIEADKAKTVSLFKRYRLSVAVAAALVAVLLLPVYFTFHTSSSVGKTSALVTNHVQWDSVVSGTNFRREIRLTDGTEITLNFSSTLRFPAQFDDSIRVVYLSGEAFFKVHKDAQHPFIVKTENGSAQDLGTEFDVDAYPANNYMAVTVTEGKVSFSAGQDNKNLILTEGLRGVYHYASSKMIQTEDHNTWASWSSGHLSIPDMRMTDVALLLQKNYGADVEITPSLLSRHFTGNFENASLEDVARQIAFVLPCNYSVNKNKVHFY